MEVRRPRRSFIGFGQDGERGGGREKEVFFQQGGGLLQWRKRETLYIGPSLTLENLERICVHEHPHFGP